MSVLVLLFVFTYFVSFLPFFVAERFRVPIIPFLFLFGSFSLYRIGRLAVSRNFSTALFWSIICLALYLAANTKITDFRPNKARWHHGRATSYDSIGQPDLAIKEYREAIRIRPDFIEGHCNLAKLLILN